MLSQYEILEQIGQGQYGRVYKALHIPTQKLVALKELERQRFPTNKFLREFNILVTLQHPNIVTCIGLEHKDSFRYLVMDYCDGGTLRDLMSSNQISLDEKLKLTIDILLGLEYAHNQGVVHCDLKPENILLQNLPSGRYARISDFGIARFFSETEKSFSGCTGSPAYMAPERFYGKYCPASDLYSIGIILFELLLNQRPFSGAPGELMSAHLNQSVVIPNTVPFLLRSPLQKAMQKLPQHRFKSATQMLKSIQLALEVYPNF